MHRIKSSPVLAALLCALVSCTSPPDPNPVTAISTIDLPRYMGRWFELAKYPNRFQTQCVGDTTATYSLLRDGAVEVDNRCRTATGTIDEAIGRAEKTGAGTEATLRVRFAPAWLDWLPLVWGKYWVIDLDPDYSLVAISEPTRAYLWILSRTPTVEPARYQALLRRLRAQGFDTDHLVVTPQAPVA